MPTNDSRQVIIQPSADTQLKNVSGGAAKSIFDQKLEQLNNYEPRLRIEEQGTVLSTGDGIAWLSGLPSAAMDEIITFEDGSSGLVFYLGNNAIGSILLHQTQRLTAGTKAFRTARQLSIPTGDALLGRVVDPLGTPLDGQSEPNCESRRKSDTLSPPIVVRSFVDRPLYTGTKIIDCLIPIGKGQRQLIIGDTGLGKSSLCLNTVLNQAGKNVLCVYVMIGQKRSSIVQTLETLRQTGALAYTVMVVAEANSLPGLQYLAPFAGCAIAEHWMWQGKDTLIVYDDLTTHARTYRELSLLLRRSPGREAYPGDVFFLHSRLLERSTCLSTSFGGGSMTALPIVETDQGEIATYIPTNLISITDGQLYLDRRLYVSGFRPAIDITRSVSRIGGKAQDALVKNEVGRLRLDYLQFLELEIFTRFGSKLEASVQRKIDRGRLVRGLLKQERLDTLPIEDQLSLLIAINEGFLDKLDKAELSEALTRIKDSVWQHKPKLYDGRSRWVEVVSAARRARVAE